MSAGKPGAPSPTSPALAPSLLASAGILVVLLLALLLAAQVGARGRRWAPAGAPPRPGGPPPTVVRNASELFGLLQSRGGHGRLLVHVGKFLHHIPISVRELPPPGTGSPGAHDDLLPLYVERVSHRNVLWVLMQAAIVREVAYVLPPASLSARLNEVDPSDPVIFRVDERAIVAHDWGSRRTLADALPHRAEPVLLAIDASYFAEGSPSELVRALRREGPRADLFVLNRSEDNPDVSDESRGRLDEFARAWSGP